MIRKTNTIFLIFCFFFSSIVYGQRPETGILLEKEFITIEDNQAFIIMPDAYDNQKPIPWVWFAPVLNIVPTENDTWYFEQFLENGIAIAGIDVGESYGNPPGTAIYQSFYEYLTGGRNFSGKPCLLARSRGGLMLYNWAVEHPDAVGGIAGIFPVCDLRSYPGLNTAAKAYEMTVEELDRMLTDYNPVDRIAVLAEARVPVYHMHGDVDNLVPMRENSYELKKRYDGYGGNMILEIMHGQGHNYWPGWYTNQKFADFVIENATGIHQAGNRQYGIDHDGNRQSGIHQAENRQSGIGHAGNRQSGIHQPGKTQSGISHIADLKCEYQSDPNGIDVEAPRLSWKIVAKEGARGVSQNTFQVIVTRDVPGEKDEIIWDSGKMISSRSNGIHYQGPALQSRDHYSWKVRVWDENDIVSDWSDESHWGMGILRQDEWEGDWIKSDLELYDYQKELKKMPDHARQHARNIWKRTGDIRKMTSDVKEAPAVWMRKSFTAPKQIHRATAYISGLGFYELYVNGIREGDSYFHTANYDYGKTIPYLVHDITNLLKEGNNVIGVILGNGYFNPVVPCVLREYANDFINTPQLKCEIKLEYEDGSVAYIASDQSWKFTTDGPIRFNSLRAGETYDARLEMGNWSTFGYDDSSWKSSLLATSPGGKMKNQAIPPMRIVDTIPAVSVSRLKGGPGSGNPHDNAPIIEDPTLKKGWLFDIGEQSAGWVRLKIRGERGQKITIIYPGTNSHTLGRYQTSEYICKGNGDEYFDQRFSFNGYRHVYVYGLDYKPDVADLTGYRVVSDFTPAGTFECSDDKINKIQEVLLRTIKNYNTQMPQDPDREKSVWTQDVQSNFENAAYNFDLNTLYRKWQGDFIDQVQYDGYVPTVVPSAFDGPSINGPWWGGMIIFNPWQHYQCYGNPDILSESYESMKVQFAYLSSIAKDNIVEWGLGDWQDIHSQEVGVSNEVETSVPYSSTCAYYLYADIIQQTARLLGKTADAIVFQRKMNEIRKSIYDRFFDAKTGIFDSGSQTSYVLALKLNIVYNRDKERLLEKFANRIAKDDYHLSCGFVGMPFLLNILKEEGLGDLAWKIATQDTYPGWYDMVLNRGNTVLMEDWDVEYVLPPRFVQMPSLAGSIGAYYYRSLGGIRPDTPGYENIIIQPYTETLDWVNCSYNSPYGEIQSNWTNENGILKMEVSVPPNARATVYIPGKNITENGKPVEESEFVHFFRDYGGYKILRVESGTYTFRSEIN